MTSLKALAKNRFKSLLIHNYCGNGNFYYQLRFSWHNRNVIKGDGIYGTTANHFSHYKLLSGRYPNSGEVILGENIAKRFCTKYRR